MSFNESESNELHNLDDVNSRLYRRDLANRKVRRFDSLTPKSFLVKNEWIKEDEEPKPKPLIEKVKIPASFFRKFFYYSIGFACLAIIIALITFITGGNTVSNTNIDINVVGNSFVGGGEELPLQVEVINKNASNLELADLFVEYDKGGDASSGSNHIRDIHSLGTVTAGKATNESVFVTLYGEEGSVKNVDFTLQYRLHGSNAIFLKKYSFPVTINSAPVTLTVDGIKNITPNQKLTFTVKTKSNSKSTLFGMLLHVDYPTGFNFESSIPSADAFNNVWDIGDLAPGAERDVVVTGTVYGQNGEDRAFHIYTGSVSGTDNTKIGVTYNSMVQTVSLVKPFIASNILISGSSADTVPVLSDSTVNASINYSNNLPTRVTNAEVSLTISGNALDPASIVAPNGFYDSSKGMIIWNQTTDSNLSSIEPSDNGVLTFTFHTLPLFGNGKVLSKPSIKLSVSIKGQQPDQGGIINQITDFQEKTAVVDSDIGFSTEAFYYSGPFSNTGSVPPKANQPTTYTVTWTVTNSASALSNGIATATLPTYVDWVGTVSPNTESVTYNDASRTITWHIGQIPAGSGPSGSVRNTSFQVRLTPSTSQIGSVPKLVLDVAVSAKDTFTGENLTTTRPAISTLLQNDSSFPTAGEIVTQ